MGRQTNTYNSMIRCRDYRRKKRGRWGAKVRGLILGIIEFTVSMSHQEKENPILGLPVCPGQVCNVKGDKCQAQNAGDEEETENNGTGREIEVRIES